MKVECNGNDLSDAVARVIKAVSARSTNAVLEGIRMTAEDGTLTLTATDLELSIEHMIRASVVESGEVVVPGKLFGEFVKKLTAHNIVLSSGGERLKINYDRSEGEFGCYPVDQYPVVNQIEDTQHFEMKNSEFRDLVNKVAFSVCTDDAHPTLKGVLLEIAEDGVTAVALDGYRLAKCVKPIVATTASTSIVVPARAIMEISRLVPDNDGEIKFNLHKNYLMVRIDATTVTTRLIDGEFVNYRQIVPQHFDTQVYIPKAMFEDAIDRAVLMARTEKNNYLVRFDIAQTDMTVRSHSDVGTVEENLPVKTDGADISISFNARYFTEFLHYMNCETIVLNLTNATSACVVSPAGGLDEYIYLVLPVRSL
ncbi:MAG: DNA polymerase III subunit beta [Clostridia bacterium]|jgi:DNA polymerase-3 subunit beta|nr:DNA polymerase III subunit beta [Clostridia bacterium]MCI9460165.1 DNA polymerase III subunit beta [Clostridia bacterium]